MQLVKKIRACLITFILLISSLSLFVIPAEDIKADEPDFEEIFRIITGLHPYITAGMYANEGNDTIHVSGDIVFDLYYASSFYSKWKYKDDIKVSLYLWNETLIPSKIENGSTQKTLQPTFLDGTIQKIKLKIEDMDFYLNPGELLIVTVEIIQSGKPIGNIIENRFEKQLLSNLRKVANWLNESDNEQLNEFGTVILGVLEITEFSGITGEEIASLANSFSSSSFIYNSSEYPSSLTLPITTDENLTLNFRSTLYDFNDTDSDLALGVELTNKSLNGTAKTWPARLINPETSAIEQFDWFIWVTLWADYIISDVPTDPEDEDKIFYYLSKEGKLVLSEPKGSSPLELKLKDTRKWEGISIDRNKIIKNASVELYLYFPKLLYARNPSVSVRLYDETAQKPLATGSAVIERSTISEILQGGPDEPTKIDLEILDNELWYDHNISLKISSTGVIIAPLKSVILVCDSADYPSSIAFKLDETDNINIIDESHYEEYEEENEKYIIAGGSAEFIYDITSKYEETVEITVEPIDSNNIDNFHFDYPESVHISKNDSTRVHLYVNSTENSKSAYDEYVKFFFNVTGNTGFDNKKVFVEVSDDAVKYDIDVIAPKCKEIKHGETKIYSIIIQNNNTGYWPDSYTIEVESEHDWDVAFESQTSEINTYYDSKEEFVLKLNVSVPEFTELSSDKLTINIYSNEADDHDDLENVTIIIKTIVIPPNIFEHFYHFFEGVSEDIGLDETVGSYGAALLIFILVFIILIFMIVIIYLLTRKNVEIVCLDRIKEINPDEEANYDITINNPSKKDKTYTVNAVMENEIEGWKISLDKKQVVVGPKGSVPVTLTVKPTDYIKPEDWNEVKVIVKIIGREKSEEISTVTSIIGGKPELNISGVFHWPRLFKKGEKIETSFRLTNKGNVSANNITIILIVNGKEKNKVEDITIPRGGYAEIAIPWIAVKGKNKIDIVVK
jgi:uncharacterized membrane protein